MWQVREPGPIIAAAERAAESGNFDTAERLLREAARLQEADLGPRHPDLANTLNNLGIVCEKTGKLADAEQYYRRAVSIARTSLPPDHPFVTTSQQNLRDFCAARGKPVEPSAAPAAQGTAAAVSTAAPASAPARSAPAPQQAASPAPPQATPPQVMPPPAVEDPEATSKQFFTRVALGALGPIAMLMVVLAAGLPRLGAPELKVSLRPTESPAAAAPSQPSAPGVVTSSPADDKKPAPAAVRTDTRVIEAADTPAIEDPVVVRARLCGELEDWACDPADRPVPSGPLFFYTQVTSASATTIQHRWYHEDRLQRSVELRIQPNQGAGYRTYSRNVMSAASAGRWRIEVRSANGSLLHEERFTVRPSVE